MLPRRLAALLLVPLAGCVGYDGVPEEVAFEAPDGARLAGTLVLPEAGAQGVPAVVVLHGSEPATRSLGYRALANVFLTRGMAAFLYDKRGAGASEGDHDERTFEALLGDAQAALAAVRTHPAVDPDAVGVVAASESGWFAPELAVRDGRLAFVVGKSAPCGSWRETVAWEVYHEALGAGADSATARAQVEVLEEVWAYRLAPEAGRRSAVEAALAEWAGHPASVLPEALEPVGASYVARVGYDPAPSLARLETPALYVYGEEDVAVPAAPCAARLGALADAGRPVDVLVVEGEGHELGGVGPTGYRLAPAFEEAAGTFAARHVAR